MAASALVVEAPGDGQVYPGMLAPHANIHFTAGVGPYDVLHEWDTVSSFDSGALIQDSNTGITLLVDEGVPPSNMGPAGTTWYYRCKVTDTDDSDVQTSSTMTIDFTDPDANDRHLYMFANVGVKDFTPDDEDRHLYLFANMGVKAFTPDDEDRFLYVFGDINDDQPFPWISYTDPYDIVTPGEALTIYGFNFEGRNDGGDMDPTPRVYDVSGDLALWHEELSVTSWTINDNPLIPDEVEVVLPTILPASVEFLIIHEGEDKNPLRWWSNWYAMPTEIVDEILEEIDFGNTNVNWPTSAAQETYFIAGGALVSDAARLAAEQRFYVTSKRGPAWYFNGTDIEFMAKADMTLAGEGSLDEIQKITSYATAGTFTITFEGQTTSALLYHATADQVEAALEALSNITDVTVEKTAISAYTGRSWTVTFVDPGAIGVDAMTLNTGSLTFTVTPIVETIKQGGDEELPAAQFPLANFLAVKHERMWAANIEYADGTQHKSRIHWSALLNAEYWYGTDYIDVDPDDGAEIQGLVDYGEALMIFKNRSVKLLTGTSESTFAVIGLDNKIGTVSPYTIESVSGMILFFDRDTGVWMFDGAEFTAVSDAIKTYLLGGINYGAAYRSSAYAYQGKYYLSVPWGANTEPNRTFVFDTQTGSWTEYDYGVRDALEVGGRVFGVAPNEDEGVFRLGAGSSDNGTAIAASVETPWVAPAGHSVKHRARNVDAAFANVGGAVKLELFTDFENTTPVATQTKTMTHASSDQVLKRFSGLGSTRWESCQLKFSNVSGSDFQLNKLTLLWTALPRNRGVE